MKVRVLITSAGVASAINVISALKKSSKFEPYIHASDMSENAAGLYLADNYSLTPPASDKNYLRKIFEIVDKNKIDFIFPIHSSEIELFSSNLRLFREKKIGLFVPKLKSVNLCNSKDKFFKFMESHCIPIPKVYKYEECKDNFPVFIKPITGSSSSGAKKISDLAELEYITKNNKENFIIQEFLDWKEITVDCYVSKSKNLIGCVPRFRVKVKDGKSIVSQTFTSDLITKACKEILSLIDYQGVCNLQFFINQNKYKLIEINPRFAAGGLPIATEAGVNIPELMLLDSIDMLDQKLQEFNANLKMFRYFSEVFI